MRKRFRVALAVVILAAVVAVALTLHDREPSYEGKTLSDWVVVMRDHPKDARARPAVHMLGTNSIPLLLSWLRREDRPTLKGRVYSLKPDVEMWLVGHKVVKPFGITSYWDAKQSYRALGLLAFEELGPDGKAAIPELIQMLGEKSSKPQPDQMSMVAGAAFLVLSRMAPPSIPPLVEALSSTDEQVQQLAGSALARIGPTAKAAMPVLEKWLGDRQLWRRLEAAYIIDKLGGDPRQFVPVVIESLREADYETLDSQLDILIRYKQEARAAVPLLVAIYTNTPVSTNPTNIIIRGQVSSALKEIDPEAAAKAGVK